MADIRLFAVTSSGPRPLPLPDGATGFHDLYDRLPVGVYSSLRTFAHHKFLCLADHLARTRESMALLQWDYTLDETSLRRALHEVCTAGPWPDARVRFDVLAGPAQALGTDSRVLVALMPFVPVPPRLYEAGVAVDFAPDLSRDRSLAKTADFAIRRRAYPMNGPDAYEYLLLSKEGHILEGTGTNFYGVRDGVVWTAGAGVLRGITGKIILQLLSELNIPRQLQPLHLDDLSHLDEAALSGSSRALLPVVKIGEQVVGDGRPGPICRRILAAYGDYVGREIKSAV